MGKRLEGTPRSRVRAALRQLWLRSRERAAALKAADRRCAVCDAKASVAKGREVAVEVHHLDGVDWEELIDLVYERLLVSPRKLRVLCKHCHADEHRVERRSGRSVDSREKDALSGEEEWLR